MYKKKPEKKILIFSKPFYPSVGGVEISSRLMAFQLVSLGYKVSVITASEILDSPELDEGYSVIRKPGFARFFWESFASDLVIIKGGLSLEAGLVAILTLKKYLIYYEMSHPFLEPGNGLKTQTRNFLKSMVANKAFCHLAVSKFSMSAKCLNSSADKMVLHNPVSDFIISNNAGFYDRNIDVLFVGRVVNSKGIWVLFEALKIMDANKKKVSVVVIGEGSEKNKFLNQVSEFSSVSVDVKGYVGNEFLGDYYNNSKLVILPSLELEGYPIVIAEAQTCGAVVIASDQEPIAEAVSDAGVLFGQGDSLKLAETISSLLSNADVWGQYSRKAFEKSVMFSMDLYQSRLKSVVDMALAGD
jgi:glycogen(starch) synthase